MPRIQPFAALLPQAELAAKICELPYDVMTSDEAGAIAAGNPLSFLHISKPEIDLPKGTDPYAAAVYQQGRKSLAQLIQNGSLVKSPAPGYFLYRQQTAEHSQMGLVALASCEDYRSAIVKKHELTRPDKEDDRVRHIETVQSQTGPAFLFYNSDGILESLLEGLASKLPPYADFTAPDGVRHTSWTLVNVGADVITKIEKAFAQMPCLYIADGHHRTAAADRVARSRPGQASAAGFLSVIFPHRQLRILPYNRVLRDLNGASESDLLSKLGKIFIIQSHSTGQPSTSHELGLYLGKQWHGLRFQPKFTASNDAFESLDVTLLQKHVLGPIFGIDDARTSKRINFVGGIRGNVELEKLVDSGEYACAFSMFPTGIEELMKIADLGGIMPPKSTWFEPKLRDGMFCNMLE